MSDVAETLRNATPFDLVKQDIDDLFEEAKTWIDGSEVETQDEADTIAKLTDLARKAKKAADDARKIEAKPFDDGKAEVQARFRPVLSRADIIVDACKKALTPFLAAQEREKREAERKAREEAEAAERAAQEAMRISSGDIEMREQAEKLAEDAKKAEAAANKLAKDKGHAKGGSRAISLRTTYRPELTDLNAAIRHYWSSRQPEFANLVCELAEKDMRAGKREIPGFNIIEHKEAV